MQICFCNCICFVKTLVLLFKIYPKNPPPEEITQNLREPSNAENPPNTAKKQHGFSFSLIS